METGDGAACPEYTPRYFSNSPGRLTSVTDKSETLGTHICHLLRYLDSLLDDPSVGVSPILSSYTTWGSRALYHSSGSSEAKARRMNHGVGEEDDNLNEDCASRIASFLHLSSLEGLNFMLSSPA